MNPILVGQTEEDIEMAILYPEVAKRVRNIAVEKYAPRDEVRLDEDTIVALVPHYARSFFAYAEKNLRTFENLMRRSMRNCHSDDPKRVALARNRIKKAVRLLQKHEEAMRVFWYFCKIDIPQLCPERKPVVRQGWIIVWPARNVRQRVLCEDGVYFADEDGLIGTISWQRYENTA